MKKTNNIVFQKIFINSFNSFNSFKNIIYKKLNYFFLSDLRGIKDFCFLLLVARLLARLLVLQRSFLLAVFFLGGQL